MSLQEAQAVLQASHQPGCQICSATARLQHSQAGPTTLCIMPPCPGLGPSHLQCGLIQSRRSAHVTSRLLPPSQPSAAGPLPLNRRMYHVDTGVANGEQQVASLACQACA